MTLRYLIDAVKEAYSRDDDSHAALGWMIERKAAGMNGLIYKAQSDNLNRKPLAIKISQRDDRQRTVREFAAMKTRIRLGLRRIVPTPIVFHDQPDGLPGDVLVMEWLEGETLQVPPSLDDKKLWCKILVNFADIHAIKPMPQNKLFRAALAVTHPQDLFDFVLARRHRLPKSGTFGVVDANTLDTLFDNAKRILPMQWDEPPPDTMSLCDANIENMIVHEGRVKFVDWANSGWSDAVFDIADMLAQPSYIELSDDHKVWIRQTYIDLVEEDGVRQRIETYEKLMYLFWVCGMTQPMVNFNPQRLAGVKQYPIEHYEKYQKIYWEVAQATFA